MRKLPVKLEPDDFDEASKSITTTGETDVTELLERMGVDDFLLEYRDAEVQAFLCRLAEKLLQHVRDCGGKTVEFTATQHSRNYGPDTRVKVAVVLQIPRPSATTIVKSGPRDSGRVVQQGIDYEANPGNEPITEL